MKRTLCDVAFNALIPVDLNQCPYILFVSHGVHKHPPPPPTKAPERILQAITQIIRRLRDPSLTTSKWLRTGYLLHLNWFLAQFLRNPQLEDFCRAHGASTLAEIHASFCNKDRISAIIQKQRLLSYPQGQYINGLLFLKQIDNTAGVSTC